MKGKEYYSLLHLSVHVPSLYIICLQVKCSSVFITSPPINCAYLKGWFIIREDYVENLKKKE